MLSLGSITKLFAVGNNLVHRAKWKRTVALFALLSFVMSINSSFAAVANGTSRVPTASALLHNSNSLSATASVHNARLFQQTLSTTKGLSSLIPLLGSTSGIFRQSAPGTIQLDLSSSQANITLGSNILGSASSVVIKVAGQDKTFCLGSKVTASELLAIQQIVSGSSQSLKLNSNGSAGSGTISLNALVDSLGSVQLSDVVIPKNVTAIDNVALDPSLGLLGNLVNYGSIYALSQSPSVLSGIISANNITNHGGGIISTVIPQSLAASMGNITSGVDLTLSALGNISNSGRIVSSGALTLSAGGSIVNAATGGLAAAQPVMQAARSVNLYAGSGNITNSGLIASITNNVNIAAGTLADLNINGAGGTVQALSGAINLRDPLYSGAGNINLTGGNFLSQNLNLYSGTGTITGDVGQVTGNVNSQAGALHFNADTSVLNLGNNTITGDPTFVNFAGAININGTVSNVSDNANLANNCRRQHHRH